MGFNFHGKSQNAQHNLSKPHAEPVNIFLAVCKEICCLSQLAGESDSLTDGNEFLAARQKQEHAHCHDVKVKSNNLVAQPSHHLGFVHDVFTAVVKDDASLNCKMSRVVDEDLEKYKYLSNHA